MEAVGSVFGLAGMVFGLWALFRVENLERKLKQFDVIPDDFDSSMEPGEESE